MLVSWPSLLLAILPVVAGVLVLVFRRRLAELNAKLNRDNLGQFGERVAKNSTPVWVGVVGIGLILVGVVWALRIVFPGSD